MDINFLVLHLILFQLFCVELQKNIKLLYKVLTKNLELCFVFADALAAEEWKRLVIEHEARIKALEDKYKSLCEAAKV